MVSGSILPVLQHMFGNSSLLLLLLLPPLPTFEPNRHNMGLRVYNEECVRYCTS